MCGIGGGHGLGQGGLTSGAVAYGGSEDYGEEDGSRGAGEDGGWEGQMGDVSRHCGEDCRLVCERER